MPKFLEDKLKREYAVNPALTANQRRNFLRFLNRHGLKRFLVFDDFHDRK